MSQGLVCMRAVAFCMQFWKMRDSLGSRRGESCRAARASLPQTLVVEAMISNMNCCWSMTKTFALLVAINFKVQDPPRTTQRPP